MFNKINIYLLSFLPISIIMGNLAINLNIILINLIILFYSFHKKDWNWIKKDIFRILIIFYIYLILNSCYNYFIQGHSFEGIIRSIGFIKFILLGFSLNILIKTKIDLNKILLNWLVIIIIVILDVFFEFVFGHNIFGFISADGTRIVSFFYDESVVGAFILTFSFILCTFFLNQKITFNKKLLLNLFLFILPICILVTGERSNFIKSILLFSLIIFFINASYLFASKKIILFLLIGFISLLVFSNQTIFIKQTELFKRILITQDNNKFSDRVGNIKYFAHYDTALKIFKDNPINGVGNKNFRKKCSDEKYFNPNLKLSSQRCTTHPHQIHFELLAEQGSVGYLIFFYLIFVFLKKNFLLLKEKKNIFFYSLNFYLIIFLIPILPSGSLFSTFNGTLFWLIFSLANLEKKYLI